MASAVRVDVVAVVGSGELRRRVEPGRDRGRGVRAIGPDGKQNIPRGLPRRRAGANLVVIEISVPEWVEEADVLLDLEGRLGRVRLRREKRGGERAVQRTGVGVEVARALKKVRAVEPIVGRERLRSENTGETVEQLRLRRVE